MEFILILVNLELPEKIGRRELKIAVITGCLFKLGRWSYPGSTPLPSVSIFKVNIAAGRWVQVASKPNKLSASFYFLTYRLQKGEKTQATNKDANKQINTRKPDTNKAL